MVDPASPKNPTRADRRVAVGGLVILGGVLLCLYLPTVSDRIGSLGGDDARYLLLADALSSGQGYVNVERPGAPVHTLYPPVLPLLLAPLRALAPGGLAAAHALVVVATLAALAALFVLLRGVVGSVPALFGAALFGLMPVTARALLPILTEMPFIALSLWALVACEAHRRGTVGINGPLLAAAVLAAAAFLTRTAGVVTVVVVLVAVVSRAWSSRADRTVVRRAWLGVLVTAAIVLPALAGWALWTRVHGGQSLGYLSQFLAKDPYVPALGQVGFGALAERLGERAAGYAREVPALFLEGIAPRGSWLVVTGLALGALMLGGLVRMVRRRPLWALYLALYLAMILIWPWYGERFLLPAVPLMIMLLGLGLVGLRTHLVRHLPDAVAAGVAVAPGVVLLAACVPGWVRFHQVLGTDLSYRPQATQLPEIDFSHTQDAQFWVRQGARTMRVSVWAWGDYLTAGRWIARQDPRAVLACRKPRLTALTCGARTVALPAPAKPELWLERLATNHVRYVLSLRGGFRLNAVQRTLTELRAKYPERIRVRATFTHVEVLEIVAPSTVPASAPMVPVRS